MFSLTKRASSTTPQTSPSGIFVLRFAVPGLNGAGHIFRHTFASLLLHRAPPSRGVLMYIQRQMGHASLETAINTYTDSAQLN
jgi:integrase